MSPTNEIHVMLLHEARNDVMSKIIALPEKFRGDRKEFADWWRNVKLYLKFNRITDSDDKIATVTSFMIGETAGFFAREWQEKLINEGDHQDWDKFVHQLQSAFALGNEAETAKLAVVLVLGHADGLWRDLLEVLA